MRLTNPLREMPAPERFDALAPFLPRVVHEWLADEPDRLWREVDATVVFVDVSGFTRLSERLARLGRVGAEELTEVIGSCFAHLLEVSYAEGGGLLKFGGDALLILFAGPDHAERGCRAALGMRSRLRDVGRVDTPGGRVRLRMSVGVNSGQFLLFLVGASHREFVITGPAATETVIMEGTADAGEIVVSSATARLLPASARGEPKGSGVLLRRSLGPSVEQEVPMSLRTRADLAVAIPAALREHLLAGGDEPEHRVATVAFVHFDDVDDLVATEGPAALAAALEALVTEAATAAEEHGVTFLGTDVDRDGGKIILAAGVPRAAGEDEERMLRAVRRIVESAQRLPVRIGVHRGHVFAGEIGPPYRRTYTVMGDTVNLAARLMAAAAPGTILATAGVLEQARSSFETEALPPFMVKGKSRPVQAYRVGALRRARRDDHAVPLALVGRDDEVALLHDAVVKARAGSGCVIELRGEPGIGKSRLIDEVGEAAADLVTAHVTCVPYETANPYWAFREILHQLLGVGPDDGPAVVEQALRSHVNKLAPELEPSLPLLAIPLQLQIPDTPQTAALEPRFRKQRVEECSVSLVGSMLHEPSLVVLEDAHWIDEASSDILRVVETGISTGPWLVCTTRIDTPGGFQASDESSRVIRLEPLPTADAEVLANAACEDRPLRPHEIELVMARAGGNPRFLIELVREAVAAGGVQGLPDSVDSLVSAQIDRLPAESRRHLREAAVLGNAFDEHLLAAVMDGDNRRAVEVLEREGLLVADGPGRLRFSHGLLRDVAYEGISYRTRQELHGRVADALERTDDADDHASLLSLHLFHSGRYEPAWRHASVAAARARDAFANVEAAGLYERALAAARRATDVDPAEMATVAEALGDVRESLGVYDLAGEAYRTARRSRPDDPVFDARLCLKEAWTADRLGRYSNAIRWARRGLRRLEGADAPGAASTRAQLAVFYATIRQAQGNHREAVRACRHAIALAQEAEDRDAVARAYFILDWAYMAMGKSDLAIYSATALELFEELGDLKGQGLVANAMGTFDYTRGRWDEALASYERGREARVKTGDAVEAARGTANIAEILIEQLRLTEAAALLDEAKRVNAAAGYHEGVAFTTALQGRLATRLGDFDAATARFTEARDLYISIGGGFAVLEVDTFLADCLAAQGDNAAALLLADTTIAAARRSGDLGLLGPSLLRTRARTLAERGDLHGARAAVVEALELARAGDAAYEIALTLEAIARVDEREGVAPDLDAWHERDEIFSRLGVSRPPRAADGSADSDQ
jgi:class 3 adenylate cyclase/tetratricopeptide (TPR) repeat protein